MKRSREILDRLKADGERLPVPESLKPEWIDETIKELEREEKKSRAGRSRRKETGRGRAGRFQIRALAAAACVCLVAAGALAVFREKEKAVPSSQTEYRIARLYANGLGVEADDAEAEHWFRLAAEKENLFAQNALASLLLKQGKPEEAALWLERAVKQGNPAAQYALGRLHLLGTGVPQDRVLAMELLGRSAAQGDSRAAELAKEPERVSILPAAMAVTRMLHHMSRIFEHNCKQDQVFQGLQIDRKRWRELQELRIAMGHMPDDHEEIEISLR